MEEAELITTCPPGVYEYSAPKDQELDSWVYSIGGWVNNHPNIVFGSGIALLVIAVIIVVYLYKDSKDNSNLDL
jgi:hypothetical protein